MIAGSKLEETMNRTIETVVRMDAFWDRWLSHGIELYELDPLRTRMTTIEHWTEGWFSIAMRAETAASHLRERNIRSEAEYMYRVASLSYNLLQWIYPDRNVEKQTWYGECLRSCRNADSLSAIKTRYVTMTAENYECSGRIRIPLRPIGCIILVNSMDSTKEEYFTYENDFSNAGFITVSFDGPGQGETFTMGGLRGTKVKWEHFMDRLIEFAANEFSDLPIHLFGTSTGAAWAIYGSCHPLIYKTVAVGTAMDFERFHPEQRAFPDFNKFQYFSPILAYKVRKGPIDPRVLPSDMDQLFQKLPASTSIMEYEEKGHYYHNRLEEIRHNALRWLSLM